MLSANMDSWLFTYLYFFFTSSYLIALARNSRTMLNTSGESGHPCLFLTVGKWFQFFLIKYDFGYRFVIYCLYNVEVHPSIPSFLRAFIMKWYWILSKAFSASIEMIKCFFVFASINVLYYIYWFVYVELSLHPWDEADLVVVNDLFDMLLDSVCHYFIEDFYINVH
jgi:hypothetical protein